MRLAVYVPAGLARRFALTVALIAVAVLAGSGRTSFASSAGSPAAQAAPLACTAVIPVFQDAIANCREINSNYACYGAYNTKGNATSGLSEKLRFQMPEDRAPIERFQTLSTLPFRTTFGVALMRVTQAEQTEPVTAILFGDSELTRAEAQAGRVFTLQKVDQNLVCQETPPGMAIRVPSGKTGKITINGIDITLGSTAFVAALSDHQVVIVNLEGNVVAGLPVLGAQVRIPPGSQTVITVQNGQATAFSEPQASPYAKSVLLQWLARTGLSQVNDPNAGVSGANLPSPAGATTAPGNGGPPSGSGSGQPGGSPSAPGSGQPGIPRSAPGGGQPALPPAPPGSGQPGGLPGAPGSGQQGGQQAAACGGPIAFGQSIVQANTTPGQECIYQFCANAGDVATVQMDRLGGKLDPYIDLRAPDKSLIKWNDDILPGTNSNSLICNQPLPASSCGYTIVARASSNDSSGAFRLTLNGTDACTPPPPQCSIVASAGVNLRSGPGLQYGTVGTLPAGAKVVRLSWNPGDAWMQVSVPATNQQGWVRADAQYTYCDDASTGSGSQPVAPPQPAQGSKTVTPTPVSGSTLTPTPTGTGGTTITPTVTPTPFAPPFNSPTPTVTATSFVPPVNSPTPTVTAVLVPPANTHTPTPVLPANTNTPTAAPPVNTNTPTTAPMNTVTPTPVPPVPAVSTNTPTVAPPANTDTPTPVLQPPAGATPRGNQGAGNGIDPPSKGCIGKTNPGCSLDDTKRGKLLTPQAPGAAAWTIGQTPTPVAPAPNGPAVQPAVVQPLSFAPNLNATPVLNEGVATAWNYVRLFLRLGLGAAALMLVSRLMHVR